MIHEYLRRARSLANRLRNDERTMSVLEHYAMSMIDGNIPVSSAVMISGIPLPGYVRIRKTTPRAVFHPHRHTHIPEYFAVMAHAGIPVPLTVGVLYNGSHIGCISEDVTDQGKYKLFGAVPSNKGYIAVDPETGAVIDTFPESVDRELQGLSRRGRSLPLPFDEKEFVVQRSTVTGTYRNIILSHPSKPLSADMMDGLYRIASWRNAHDRLLDAKLERRIELAVV